MQLAGPAYVERFVASQAMNRSVLLQPSFREEATVDALDEFDRTLQRHAQALGARAEAGRLREGHGDLRPEHIGLDGTPVVIDCLEFNRALREVDPFDELAFLDLECRMLGADWIGPRLIAHCCCGAARRAAAGGDGALHRASRAGARATGAGAPARCPSAHADALEAAGAALCRRGARGARAIGCRTQSQKGDRA